MFIKKIFHKIGIGLKRKFQKSIPSVEPEKLYGKQGELKFFEELKNVLPSCEMKNNIIVSSDKGDAEIDSLILYRNKLFAVEIKNWKGKQIEHEGKFYSYKRDKYLGINHIKPNKSPFDQVNRAIGLLKRTINGNVWINAIVYFQNNRDISIESGAEKVWFSDINELADYIRLQGKICYGNTARDFFGKCVASDCLFATERKFLQGNISFESLCFAADGCMFTRNDIKSIHIKHKWSFDNITLRLKNGEEKTVKAENAKLNITIREKTYEYFFSKLANIELGYALPEEKRYGRIRQCKEGKYGR